ncbi:hypothetical protein C9374_011146 [Naegleria lovaniensis]|uniref:Uncharacterized protein n=1 Tax=Naegleria lovaniensis TaxID=51637 RepID=A0AA88GEE0_NAELO|nr:uncharacterized protein C9374_011146 [Naegleria lovaniensis]KAG2374067.1 hypothetical protein C9374_011146 [Naegleria lovaniensis]
MSDQEQERDWTFENSQPPHRSKSSSTSSYSPSMASSSSEFEMSCMEDWMLQDFSNTTTTTDLNAHHVHLHHHLQLSEEQKNETNSSTQNALLEALGLEEDEHGNLVSNAASYLEDDEDFEVSRFIENYCSAVPSSSDNHIFASDNGLNNRSANFENSFSNKITKQTTFDTILKKEKQQQLTSTKKREIILNDSIESAEDYAASENTNQQQKTLSPSKDAKNSALEWNLPVLEDSSLHIAKLTSNSSKLNNSSDLHLKEIDGMIQNILQKYQTPQKQQQANNAYTNHASTVSSNSPQCEKSNRPLIVASSSSSKSVKPPSQPSSSINLLAQYSSPKIKSPKTSKTIDASSLLKKSPTSSIPRSKNSTSLSENASRPNTTRTHEISKTSSTSFREKEGESFFERAVNWKSNVEKARKQKEKELDRSIKQECSFKPEINPMSLGKRDDDIDVHDRLYIDSFRASDKNDEIRHKLTEEEFRKTCTFKPKLLNKFSVSSKYLDISPKKVPSSIQEEPLDEECTFKPQTNDSIFFNKSCMDYLSEDAFSRLSKRKTPNISRSDQHVVDNEKFDMLFMSRPKSAGKFRPSSNFQEFLKRQQDLIEDRDRKVDFIKMTEHPFKPSLNEKSVAIVNRTEFEKRCEFYQQRRELSLKRAVHEVQQQCTFKPNISEKARNQPQKSVNQLCRDGLDQKERKLQQMQQELLDKELQGATFKPNLSRTKDKQLSTSIVNNSFLLEKRQHARERKMQEIAFENERKLMSECTFKPVIHDSPSYVKKIARSMSATRTRNASQSLNEKPQWR